MNPEGEVIWEARPTSEADLLAAFAKAKKLVELQAALKAKPDDELLEASASLLEGLGRQQRPAPAMSQMEAWAEVEGLDEDVVATFRTWQTRKKISDAMRKPGACYELLKKGTQPEAGSGSALRFFMSATREAVAAKDAETAIKAWEGLEPAWKDHLKNNPSFAENPRAKRTIDMVENLRGQVKSLQKAKAVKGPDR